MFAVLVSGRLPNTDFQRVDETHFVTNIENADDINHVAVFMTGQEPFPDSFGGAVYFSWPGSEGWQLLGHIANDKPSAMFKITGLKNAETVSLPNVFDMEGERQKHIAQIGISVEPASQLTQLSPVTSAAASTVSWQLEFGTKMCEKLYNFVSSFSVPQGQMHQQVHAPAELYVPLRTITEWYANFQRRLQENPNFWK